MFPGLAVLNTILPVVVMLVIGTICRRNYLFTPEGIQALKSMAVNITLPAVMLNAFASTTYTSQTVLVAVLIFCACLLSWFLGRTLGSFFHLKSHFVPFITSGYEAGMLGYSLFIMLYGSERTAEFACIDLGQVLFVFTFYKLLLGINTGERPRAKELALEMLHSPVILAIGTGIFLGASGLYQALTPFGIRGLLDTCTDFVSAPTSAIILLTIGYDLVLRDIPWRSAAAVVALRMGIMLSLRVALGLIFDVLWPGHTLGQALTLMFLLPAPYVLPVFARDKDQQVYLSSSITVSTLTALIAFAILAALR